ncbi:glycosyl hydrolase family 28 protein [Chryseolinea sp. T2]|uniref:glycoside hydrolase family 28 protein n=1 Tax=Chryseolinea sp. T2 TaxID=3129255 RepID=UPI003077DBD5
MKIRTSVFSRRTMLAYAGGVLGITTLTDSTAAMRSVSGVVGKNASNFDTKNGNLRNQDVPHVGAGTDGTSFNVRNYGATGLRKDNATKAFRDAINACTSAGGGTVEVPAGEYTVGTVQLLDNVTLHLEAGATLFASQQESDYVKDSDALIFAENAKNISVTGKGTIDGLARYDYDNVRGADPEIAREQEIARQAGIEMKRYYRSREAMNIFLFVLNDCTNIHLEDISIINAPLWTVRLNDCDRVNVRGVYIYSDLEKGVNADGIDICSSKNVTISDSTIITADDAIVLKAIARNGRKANPVENVTVTNCVLTSSSTALMIGTEWEADIHHVVFNNCVIRNSNKGFGINVQDGAVVSNVIFSNLTIETSRRHWNWWGSAEMCKFVLKKRTETSPLGMIRDIFIDNIVVKARGTTTITGHPSQPLDNIRMTNVQLFMDVEDAKDKRATDAMVFEHLRDLQLNSVSVEWSETPTESSWRSALVMKNVTGFTVDNFSGRQGLRNKAIPAVSLDNCTDGIVRNSTAPEETETFIHISGTSSKDIIIKDNRTTKAKKAVTFENDAVKKAVILH